MQRCGKEAKECKWAEYKTQINGMEEEEWGCTQYKPENIKLVGQTLKAIMQGEETGPPPPFPPI